MKEKNEASEINVGSSGMPFFSSKLLLTFQGRASVQVFLSLP